MSPHCPLPPWQPLPPVFPAVVILLDSCPILSPTLSHLFHLSFPHAPFLLPILTAPFLPSLLPLLFPASALPLPLSQEVILICVGKWEGGGRGEPESSGEPLATLWGRAPMSPGAATDQWNKEGCVALRTP